MGGSRSLPLELERCPDRASAIYISANDHGARLVGCDYIVAHDKIEDRIRPFGVPLVSRHLWADFRILEAPVANTGVIAAWTARLLGCAPIFLAGMGCWDPAEPAYHDRDEPENYAYRLPVTEHIRRWRSMCVMFPADYRPMGGPLAVHMPTWPFERVTLAPRSRLERDIAGTFVEFTVEHPHKGRVFGAGEVAEVRRSEAQHFVRSNVARAVAKVA